MDQRYWKQKRKIPIYNPDPNPIPAYAPVHFNWDYGSQGISSPWQEGTTLRGGQIIYEVSPGTSETQWWNTLYAINGPVEVPSGGYGEASIDYPLPLVIDPNGFPVPDLTNPSGLPVPGTWDAYMLANAPDAEGAPPLGPPNWQEIPNGWADFKGATCFSPLLMWYALAWDVNEDGTESRDRMIVIPMNGFDTYSYGGRFFFQTFQQSMGAGTPYGLVTVQEVQSSGLFMINANCNIELDTPGAAASINLGYTPGPGWGTSSPIQPPYLTSGSRQMPKFTVGDAHDLIYYPNDTDAVDYTIYGYETVSLSYPMYMRKGDKIYLNLTVSETCNVTTRNGVMWFVRLANNDLTGRPSFES